MKWKLNFLFSAPYENTQSSANSNRQQYNIIDSRADKKTTRHRSRTFFLAFQGFSCKYLIQNRHKNKLEQITTPFVILEFKKYEVVKFVQAVMFFERIHPVLTPDFLVRRTVTIVPVRIHNLIFLSKNILALRGYFQIFRTW